MQILVNPRAKFLEAGSPGVPLIRDRSAGALNPFGTLHSVLFTGLSYATFPLVLGIDHYITIKDPLRYQDTVTKTKDQKGCACTWPT